MRKYQKLPLGSSDFRAIREDGKYYVDKTALAEEVIEADGDVLLLPRPRRFGKTLNLSMLRYFFDDQEVERGSEALFEGLSIKDSPYFEQHFGKHPVIYLTLKDIKALNFEDCLQKMKRQIQEEFRRQEARLSKSLEKFHPDDWTLFRAIASDNASWQDYDKALRLLSRLLFIATGEKCIVLIDEYDTPIQTSYIEGYYKESVGFFKTFLGAVLKDNDENLYKAVLTGILRVSKESIFSDLNNIEIHTLINKPFSTWFGFTLEEAQQLLKDYDLSENYQEVLIWYNGYKVGDTTLLNPWSLLYYVRMREFGVYWANTSANEVIKQLVKSSPEFQQDLKVLLKGGCIEEVINPNIVFNDLEEKFRFSRRLLCSFLLFSGYLKFEECLFKKGRYHCKLSIANLECIVIFEQSISQWIEDRFSNQKLKILLKALVEADLELFELLFSEFIRDTLSYFDTAGKKTENVYHAFTLGLLVNLVDYEVLSNQESGYGRADVMLFHKTDKSKPALVIEFKSIVTFYEETKDKALESSIQQIQDREYMAKAQARGYQNVVAFGVVFDGKRVWVKRVGQ